MNSPPPKPDPEDSPFARAWGRNSAIGIAHRKWIAEGVAIENAREAADNPEPEPEPEAIPSGPIGETLPLFR
jgi:hypothetical protein